MTEVIKKSSVEMLYDINNERLVFNYNGYPRGEEIREVFHRALFFMENNGVTNMINDCSKMKGTFTKLEPFFSEVIPDMIKNGMIKNAIVRNSDVFTYFAIQKLIPVLKEVGLDVDSFSNFFLAKDWLGDVDIKIAS